LNEGKWRDGFLKHGALKGTNTCGTKVIRRVGVWNVGSAEIQKGVKKKKKNWVEGKGYKPKSVWEKKRDYRYGSFALFLQV